MIIIGIVLLCIAGLCLISTFSMGGFLGQSATGFIFILCLGLTFLLIGIYKKNKKSKK